MSFSAGVSRFFKGNDLIANSRQLRKAGLKGRVASGTRKAAVTHTAKGMPNLHTGRGAERSFISKSQAEHLHQMRGRKMIMGGAAASTVPISTAMRPGPNEQQTGYRRPMTSAPSGSGRFA